MPKDLVSKLLAAGLSAGVFLIWWPEHHPTSGLLWLIVRGGLWTLTFELLLLAFAPLERYGRKALQTRITAARLRRRTPEIPAKARLGGACVLACVGAALPLSLIAASNPPVLHRKATVTERVVVVKRPVVERERVVVRQIVTIPAASAHPDPVVIVRRAPAKQAQPKTRTSPKTSTPAPKKTTATTTPAAPAQTTPAVAPTEPQPAAEPAPADG